MGPSPAPALVEHGGYRLRGGTDPGSACLANVLARHGVRAGGAPLSEAVLFRVAGGPGAGYILWEFAHDDSRVVTLGLTSQGQYFDRAVLGTLDRLGIAAQVHRTGGAAGARPGRWARRWTPDARH